MTNRHKRKIYKAIIIGAGPAELTGGYERTSLSAQKIILLCDFTRGCAAKLREKDLTTQITKTF